MQYFANGRMHTQCPHPDPSGVASRTQGADEQGDALQAAVAKLEGLMKARQALYEQADIVIPLDSPGSSTGASLEEVVWRMLCALRDRLRDDAASKPTPPLQQVWGSPRCQGCVAVSLGLSERKLACPCTRQSMNP